MSKQVTKNDRLAALYAATDMSTIEALLTDGGTTRLMPNITGQSLFHSARAIAGITEKPSDSADNSFFGGLRKDVGELLLDSAVVKHDGKEMSARDYFNLVVPEDDRKNTDIREVDSVLAKLPPNSIVNPGVRFTLPAEIMESQRGRKSVNAMESLRAFIVANRGGTENRAAKRGRK